MRFIAIAAIAGILVLPIHASAQVSNSQNMRALNPQPEPPGLPKQKLYIKKNTSTKTLRQQDTIKLNPQPEPPGQLRSVR